MSTVTGCVLFLPEAYATTEPILGPIGISNQAKTQLVIQESHLPHTRPFLVSGPYNFDPSLGISFPQVNINKSESESLSLLGQPAILKEEKKEFLVEIIEKEAVKIKTSQAQSHEVSKNNHVQKESEKDEIKKKKIIQRLYQVAEKEIDQVERQKIKQLQQAEKEFQILEKLEKKRLKQIKRDHQKSIRISQKAQEKLAKQEKQKQIKEQKEKEKQERLARKTQQRQDKIAKKNDKKLAKLNEEKESQVAWITPVSFESSFSQDTNKSGQLNQISEGTALFQLGNGDQLSVTSGYNIYDQESVDRIHNIPIQLGWEHDIHEYTISTKVGIDLYDRLKAVPNFNLSAKKSIDLPKSWAKALIVSAEIDHAQYKFNAETIENDIRYLRLKGSLFWQIKENTSFFTSAHLGTLNDGNFEHQVFSRLERKISKKFSVAGNLFVWGFSEDLSNSSGYFSPPDFLVYNGEVAWADDITDFLSCKAAISLGKQRAQGKWGNASSLNTSCKTRISKNLEVELGYVFSNSFSGTNINDSTFFANRFTANIKAKF